MYIGFHLDTGVEGAQRPETDDGRTLLCGTRKVCENCHRFGEPLRDSSLSCFRRCAALDAFLRCVLHAVDEGCCGAVLEDCGLRDEETEDGSVLVFSSMAARRCPKGCHKYVPVSAEELDELVRNVLLPHTA